MQYIWIVLRWCSDENVTKKQNNVVDDSSSLSWRKCLITWYPSVCMVEKNSIFISEGRTCTLYLEIFSTFRTHDFWLVPGEKLKKNLSPLWFLKVQGDSRTRGTASCTLSFLLSCWETPYLKRNFNPSDAWRKKGGTAHTWNMPVFGEDVSCCSRSHMAGWYKFPNLHQPSHLLWEKFKGGEEQDDKRQEQSLFPSFLSSYSTLLASLCKDFLFCQQWRDRGATTHSSRFAPSAALPLLAVSVWGGVGRRWLACSKPRCHWRRPVACGGPRSCFWHQWRSLWSRCLGDRWTRGDSTIWQQLSVSWAQTRSERALLARLPPE